MLITFLADKSEQEQIPNGEVVTDSESRKFVGLKPLSEAGKLLISRRGKAIKRHAR